MLALLLFVMALNFFGVFEFGTSLISLDQKAANKKTAWGGSFLSGVLATVVATPCTGPFLGAALGFAMTLPWFGTLFLFTVMALGMALPFFLLTLFPGLLRFLPKPGQWMVVMKQFFGFILLATTLWLIWVFEAETGFTMVIWLLAALLVISLGAWIYGSFAGFGVSKRRRFITNTLCTLLAAGAISMVATHTEAAPQTSGKELAHAASSWEPFSEKRLQELRAAGTPVFIDFTAKWCLICQANKAVLHSQGVEEAFEKTGTVRMIADWTRGDKEITAMLKEFNRTGVPLYVLYSANKTEKPYVFSETLTPETVIAQLNS
jgi:thiol:disulfide interchange protein DsbD